MPASSLSPAPEPLSMLLFSQGAEDQRLLDGVQRYCDEASWRDFVAGFERVLRSYMRAHGVPAADADDLVQEVFVKLLRVLPGFVLDPRRGRFRAWLRCVAARTLRDHRRRERRRRRLEAEWCSRSQAQAPGGRPAGEERGEVLQQALALVRSRCSSRAWFCFEEHFLGQRPAAEVATECGLSDNAVRVHCSRVLARLRRLCRGHHPVGRWC